MADNRGGYRQPPGGQPPAGPGRYSTRTDGDQPPAAPDLDRPDIQSGDVGRLEAAQKVAPVPRAQPPPGNGRQGPSPQAEGGPRRGGLPPFLFERPSDRPGEPTSAGLDAGAGEGPEILANPPAIDDTRELILERYATIFGNEDAARMLTEIRASRVQQPQGPPTAMLPPGLAPQEEIDPTQPSLMEQGFADEEDFFEEEAPDEESPEGELPQEEAPPPAEETGETAGMAEEQVAEQVEATEQTAPPPEQ